MKKGRILPSLVYLYLSLPILIFMLGWMKPYFSIPLVVLLVWMLIRAVKGENPFWTPEWNRDSVRRVLFVLVILGIWVYLAGIGGLAWQNPDHYYRNEIFQILVNHSWPIRITETVDGVSSVRALNYYIGFWMPAAVVGKVFGLSAGFLFQALWAVAGLMLVYLCICDYRKKLEIWPLLVFIFFSGLDVIGDLLWCRDLTDIFSTHHLEWWSADFWEYSSFSTDLFWVFNQAVYAWLLVMLLMRQRENRRLVLIWSFGLFTCSLPFVGMIPYVLYQILRNFREQKLSAAGAQEKTGQRKDTDNRERRGTGNRGKAATVVSVWIRGLFTLENVVGGGIVGLISFSYIRTASSSQSSLLFLPGRVTFMNYLLFCILEFGLYAVVVYRYRKDQKLYWMTLVILFCCAFIRVGPGPDFSMRASIPALTVLYLMVIDALSRSAENREKAVQIPLVVLLCIGAVTPIHEMARTVEGNALCYEQNQPLVKTFVEESKVMTSHNFSSDADKNFFYQYLAR